MAADRPQHVHRISNIEHRTPDISSSLALCRCCRTSPPFQLTVISISIPKYPQLDSQPRAEYQARKRLSGPIDDNPFDGLTALPFACSDQLLSHTTHTPVDSESRPGQGPHGAGAGPRASTWALVQIGSQDGGEQVYFFRSLGFARGHVSFHSVIPPLPVGGTGSGAGLSVRPAPGSRSRSIMASRGVPQARARSNQSSGWGEFASKESPFNGQRPGQVSPQLAQAGSRSSCLWRGHRLQPSLTHSLPWAGERAEPRFRGPGTHLVLPPTAAARWMEVVISWPPRLPRQ